MFVRPLSPPLGKCPLTRIASGDPTSPRKRGEVTLATRRAREARPMADLASAAVNVAFHGLTLAMVLYLISVGLSVTMGLMGFVNLAHGAFAMAGGYVASTLIARHGVPFAL